MRIIVIVFLLTAGYSCNKSEEKKINLLHQKIVYDKAIDSLESNSYLDSLSSQMDCDDSILNTNTTEKVLRDSIKILYEQIVVRLDSIKLTISQKQNAEEFKKALVNSMDNFDTLLNADQRILFYSYGNATMQGEAAKCYQIYLLQQRFIFLKAIFANAYWNYDFDSFPLKK
jgi:hypothetical protein